MSFFEKLINSSDNRNSKDKKEAQQGPPSEDKEQFNKAKDLLINGGTNDQNLNSTSQENTAQEKAQDDKKLSDMKKQLSSNADLITFKNKENKSVEKKLDNQVEESETNNVPTQEENYDHPEENQTQDDMNSDQYELNDANIDTTVSLEDEVEKENQKLEQKPEPKHMYDDHFDQFNNQKDNKEKDEYMMNKEFEEKPNEVIIDKNTGLNNLMVIKRDSGVFDELKTKYKVHMAFVDWFIHDVPLNAHDSLENRKITAINMLTQQYLMDKLSKDSNTKSEDMETFDQGGFLTEYHDYINKNIAYLINAIQFYNGSENSIDGSNWIATDEREYLRRLALIAFHGKDYINKTHSSYKAAIQRLIDEIQNDNVSLKETLAADHTLDD